MKLKKGQKITIGGKNFKVIGALAFHTYNDYHLQAANGDEFWLDDCAGGWRLWEEIPINAEYFSSIKDDLIMSIGSSMEDLDGVTIMAVGSEIVKKSTGQVDDTEEGEIVFYAEGEFPSEKIENGFNLFCAEDWAGEVECFRGKIVEVQ